MYLCQTCTEKYSLQVLEMTEMEGYEDFNLMVRVHIKPESANDRAEKVYVLKISHFSTDRHTLELQNKMLIHLTKHGIMTCTPQKTSSGAYTELFTSQKDKKVYARLLDYVEGVTFEASGKPAYLLHPIGTLVGKVCNILQSFRFENYKPSSSPFDLHKALVVEEYIDKYLHGDTREMARQILHQYTTKIQPVLDKLQQGFIIADINSRNIIVKRLKDRNTPSDYVIAGVIDLGDACKSVYLYEIAVVIGELMSTSFCSINPLTVGKQLLAGIREHFEMTELELHLLKLCICVRLVQVHLIIENIIHTQDTHKNIPYFEKCRHNFLKVCKQLWLISDEDFTDIVINK
ncbi:hydroxylysine kinase-like isoform X2 [Mercenaria mercenaria]|uniref:hydroxylysine kinase-like isoform X2 n=1 Tax=Mercenaria mercenaria TaxID=6596 RepID=UPI00234F50D2|nr:hydroxylysine kinase-like isoform X2 [Mercenaria mercenaria]